MLRRGRRNQSDGGPAEPPATATGQISVLHSRTTGRVELHGAGDQRFRFGLADSESGSAATRPVSAILQRSPRFADRRPRCVYWYQNVS